MILDMTCGSRMMWHQKSNPDTIYGDLRVESHTLSDGRRVDIKPDIRFDYRALPFPDDTFDLVNFDPPHLTRAGETGWMRQKYGVLFTTWIAKKRYLNRHDAIPQQPGAQLKIYKDNQ